MKSKRRNYLPCSYQILVVIICHLWSGVGGESVPGYSINVAQSVIVQRGMCVYLPCRFTVPMDNPLTIKATGYWIKMHGGIVAYKSYNKDISNRGFSLVGDVRKGDCTLYIEEPLPEDKGHYYFRVEDNVKFSYMDIHPYVEVTELIDKPEISPIKSWDNGEMVRLTCTFLDRCDRINPHIVWEGNIQDGIVESQVIYHRNYTNTYFSRITFTARKEHNNSPLSCIVWLKEGLITSQQITLKVECIDSEAVAGYCIKAPKNITVQRGLCVYIPCQFIVPYGVYLTRNALGIWYNMTGHSVASKSERDYQFSNNRRFSLVGDVWKGDCSFYIDDPLYEDQGTYRFRIEDKIKFSYLTITPNVNVTDLTDKPEISPINSWVDGEEVTLTCTAPGRCMTITPRFTWEGNIQNPRVKNVTAYNENGSVTHFSTISFTAMKEYNKSPLSCIVQLREGLITKQQITMQVEYPPTAPEIKCSIITKEQNTLSTNNCTMDSNHTIDVVEGSQLSLTCSVDSAPRSTFIWKFSNQTQASSSIDNHTLTNFTITTEGFYTCQATNEHGTIETSVHIRILLQSNEFSAAAMYCGCFAALFLALGILFTLFYKKRKAMLKNENLRQSHVHVADPIYGNSEMFQHGPHKLGPIPQKDDEPCPETEAVNVNCQDVEYMTVTFSKVKPKVAAEAEEETEYAVVKPKK